MKKLRITVDGKPYEVTVERLGDDGQAIAAPTPGAMPAPVAAAPVAAPPVKQASAPRAPVEQGAVTSPMAGVVLSVAVREGDTVEGNQVLLILEAMKMENQIIAPAPAKVSAVHVKAGESVTEGQPLVDLE